MTTQLSLHRPATEDEHRRTLAEAVAAGDAAANADALADVADDALAAATLARIRVERELRRSELERDQTARALELNQRPLTQTDRARLRIAYADAAASVAVHQDALERAVALEQSAIRSRAALESALHAEREDRQPDSRPQ